VDNDSYLALFGPLSLVLVATNSININTLLNMEFQKHTKLAFFHIAQHHKSNTIAEPMARRARQGSINFYKEQQCKAA
jgi:hypothetical protein